MYLVTKAVLETLTLEQLLKAKDAISELVKLDIQEIDVDVKLVINELISKKEQTHL